MKTLYWVTTDHKEEDWFIIARTARSAYKYHENAEGFERGYAKAKAICKVEKEYKKDIAYWAQLDMLKDLGFEILSEAPYRTVKKDGKIYQEGTTFKFVLMQNSHNKEGLYIVRMADTDLYKIGITHNFTQRLKHLQTGNPFIIEVIYFYKIEANRNIESIIHKKYQQKKIAGEWFKLTVEDLSNIHELIVEYKNELKVSTPIQVASGS